MDLSKFLDGPSDVLDNVFVEVEKNTDAGVTEGLRRDKRQFTYKRKGINFTSTSRDTRTLRSIQETERRKGSRQDRHSARRGISEDDPHQDLVESEENNEGAKCTSVNSKNVDAKTKSKIRREKLNEFLEQKKKVEDMKRKMAKPAFKVGIVHHSITTPFSVGGEGKPNIFSTSLNRSKSKSLLNLSKNNPKLTKS